MQKSITHKLFYKKYPFKISLLFNNSANICRLGVLRTQAWVNGNDFDKWAFRGSEKSEVQHFIDCYKQIEGMNVFARAEGKSVSIFVESRTDTDKILEIMKEWVWQLTEPASDDECEFLLENGHKKIICDRLPKDGMYQYRVYIKQNMQALAREKFYEWMQKFPLKFNISITTKKWLTGARPYVQAPFFYVSDQKMLSMVGLYLGNHVQKVEEFIVRTSINTECQV